jgi:transcription elongation factor Elf1
MTAIMFLGRSKFGAECGRCGEEIIAPESSGFLAEGQIRNFWCCSYCGHEFETSVDVVPAKAVEIDITEQFFPSLLVA